MGYTVNRFFIVHTWDEPTIDEARKLALAVFKYAPELISEKLTGVVNGVCGFMVWTSGSKSGWEDDEQHLESVNTLITQLSQLESPPRWCWIDSGEIIEDLRAEHGYDGNYTHTYEFTSRSISRNCRAARRGSLSR